MIASPVQAQDTILTGDVPFVISNVAASDITATGAAIIWETNASSTSQVLYDTFSHSSPGEYPFSSSLDSNLQLNHQQTLSNLTGGTVYYCRVRSTASVGGTALTAVSSELTFTTSPGGTGDGTGGGTGGGDTGDETGGGVSGTSDKIFLGQYQSSPGVFSQDVSLKSWDGIFTLVLPANTTAKTIEGWGMSYLTLKPVAKEQQNLPAPQGGYLIGLTYEAGPSGATFTPSLVINILYDESLLPPGIQENDLVPGYWNETTRKWEILSNSQVDTAKNLVSGTTSHFSVFTILGYPPKSPNLTVSDLIITPVEASVGEEVSVSASVTNSGNGSGDYEVVLELDNKPVDTREVNLEAGASQTVTFTTTPEVAGTYNVELNGLSGSFKVSPPEAVASVIVSDLTVSEPAVKVGQKVTISALLTNPGNSEAVYKLNLMLNNSLAESREVTVSADSTEIVSFTFTPSATGSYNVNLEGLSGTFEVILPSALANFTITEVSVTPEKIFAGDNVTVTALIANAGELAGTFTVMIKVDGRVEETGVFTLPGKSQKNVTYTVKVEGQGEHQIQINELSRTVVAEVKKNGKSLLITGIVSGTITLVLVTVITLALASRKYKFQINR
jgi:hypothetical protein